MVKYSSLPVLLTNYMFRCEGFRRMEVQQNEGG